MSDFQWGDVQVEQLLWQRVSDETTQWQAQLRTLRYGDIALGSLDLACDQQREASWWSCDSGQWQWQSPAGVTYNGTLQLQPDAEQWLALNAQGLALQVSGQGGDLRWRLNLESPDLAALLPWWPKGLALQPLVWQGGVVLRAEGGVDQAKAILEIDAMDFDSEDGRVATGAVSLSLSADATWHDGYLQVQARGEAGPGAVLWNDLYLELGDRRAEFELNLGARPDAGEWFVEHVAWRDPPAINLAGHGRWVGDRIQQLEIEELALDLATLTPAYLSGWLAGAALSDLQLEGQVAGRLDWRDDAVRDFRLNMTDVNAVDGRQRFTVQGIHGDLNLSQTDTEHSAPPAASQLRWEAVNVWGLGADAGRIRGHLQADQFELIQSTRLPILDGALRLDRLRIRRGDNDAWDLDLGAELEPISMAQLTDVFGWPPFGGKVGGKLPGARYENGVLRLDGALDFEIFNGRVRLQNLALERTFGSLPSMSGDLSVQALDLEPLTQAFSFGRITGLLEGEVKRLRLLNWQPVAFDARFATVNGGGRISQRAVDNLSRIGGGGGAALGGIVGALFEEFPYRELGLSCRLQNNVCHMNGVRPSPEDNAYFIVVGRSLPRITIKGFQKQVDWPVLLNQLKQIIANGASPEIR